MTMDPGATSAQARWTPTRREAWLSVLLVFAVAIGVRILAAAIIGFPKPEDTAYYVGAARNLVEGRGLVSDALWSFGTPPLVFPRPAFEVWLPLPSLLAAIPMALFGGPAPIPLDVAMRTSQVVPVLAGSIVSVLAWRLAADVAIERGMSTERGRTLALGTGIASSVYLPLVLHSALPDSTLLFGALVLGAGLLMTRVLASPRGARWRDPRLLGIGLLVGLSALTRNEAVWLALVWAWLAWRLRDEPRSVRVRLIAVVAVVSLLVFAPWASNDEHIARMRAADLFLDTLPYNAHTTASDALWAGLPLVTCVGETFAARVGGSILRAAGLSELVTSTLTDYERLAAAIAADPQRLRELKAKVDIARLTAPLFDAARFARNIESAYLKMIAIRMRGEAPEAISIEDSPS